MTDVAPPEDLPGLINPSSKGQVCDRCRTKKIKCNAAFPCDKCSVAGVECTVSATLRRKTTARGFSSSESDTIQRLESANAMLLQQLDAERKARARLQEDLTRSYQTTLVRKRKVPNTDSFGSPQSTSADSQGALYDQKAYVVKHMGRLVRDQSGVGRFAGSTTGVHFVLSVQDACRSVLPSFHHFPEPCYNSHLLQPTHRYSGDVSVGKRVATTQVLPLVVEDAQKYLPKTLQDVLVQFQLFENRWSSFCPVIIRDDLLRQAAHLFNDSERSQPMVDSDYPVLLIILAITRINRPYEAVMDAIPSGADCDDDLICRLYLLLSTKAELWSLQALVLYSLYIQRIGQRLTMIPLNGVMVQIAQSLGLHRHARRFKFAVGEVELRKRIWWCVYIFDKLTSIIHGTPQLISNTDIDNDLPVDCVLQDTTLTQLVHPLPGEPTSVSLFNHYLGLIRISSKMLTQLYTTTDRRGGADKIKRLDLDLQVWVSNFNNHPHVDAIELGNSRRKRSKVNSDNEYVLMGHWLELSANLCRILINRPGLTFDQETPQFGETLFACTSSATAVISLLSDDILDPRLYDFIPSGPSLIFQCALLHAYCHCCNFGDDSPLPSCAHSVELIGKSTELLGSMTEYYPPSPDPNVGTINQTSPLIDLIRTLHSLQVLVAGMKGVQSPSAQTKESDFVSTTTEPEMDLHLQGENPSADLDFWSTGGIESLNQIGNMEAMFDFNSMFSDII